MAASVNQQQATVPLTDVSNFGANFDFPYIDDDPSTETRNSSGEPAIVAEELEDVIEEFILGAQQFYKNIVGSGWELSEEEEEWLRQEIPLWNRLPQSEQGAQCIADNKIWIKRWFPDWNTFLQARAGETLVTHCGVFVTIIGLLFYLLDLVSDFITCIFYACNRQWWQAIATLAFVYNAVLFNTIMKWLNGQVHCIGSADCLRYFSTLLVNWPDVKQYGRLCLLEWKLCKSPKRNARLVAEWHQRRYNVAYLKFTEGLWEACPQAILQLCLLIPNLYGDWTWTDYLRIASASVSLCTAGAALVNWEKSCRIVNYIDLPTCELVVLHMWAVPVTVSRLLSVVLLLTVYPYWGLAGVALHLVLCSVDLCRTAGVPRTLNNFLCICLTDLRYLISPYITVGSITYRRIYHTVHFLVNTVATVVWALGTPLVCAHPALYTAIICFNAASFVLGLLGWLLYEKYWHL